MVFINAVFSSILVSKTHKSGNLKLWHLSHKGPHPLGSIPCPTTPKRCRALRQPQPGPGSVGPMAGQGRAVGTWSPALLQPLRGRALGWRRDLGRGWEPPKPTQQCLGLAVRSRLPAPSPHRTSSHSMPQGKVGLISPTPDFGGHKLYSAASEVSHKWP